MSPSGNVFQFLMELKRIDFVDAVKEIANDSNIKIPEQYVSVPAKPLNNENRQLFDLLIKQLNFITIYW